MTIKVGDEVYVKNSNLPYKVLYIHHLDPSRKWYVVAYHGDMPRVYREDSISKAPPVERLNFFFMGKTYSVDCVGGVPQWGTVK